MNKGYRIAGYLGVKIDSNKIKFILTPLQKYLLPDRRYVVGYKITGNNTDDKVKLFSLSDGKLECKVSDKKIEDILLKLALDQKKVLVYIMKDNKITGFEYPVS
jgi:hypothetical protein